MKRYSRGRRRSFSRRGRSRRSHSYSRGSSFMVPRGGIRL